MVKDIQQELFKKINHAQPEELKTLILRLASLDDNLAGVILAVLNNEPVQASHPNSQNGDSNETEYSEVDQNAVDMEIRHIRDVISEEISANGGDLDYLKPRQIRALTEFFEGVIDEIQDGIHHGDIPLELSVPLLLLTYQNQVQLLPKTVENTQLFKDSLQDTMFALEEAVSDPESINENIKNRLMQQVISLFKKSIFKGMPEERYDLFFTALPLVTEKTAPKMITVSEKLEKQDSIFDMLYLESNQIMLQIRIALQLGHMDRAQQIIDDHMDNDTVLSEYVLILEAQKNFTKAEQVIQDAITRKVGDPRQWHSKLAQIYRLTNQDDKLKNLLKDELLSGNIHVYKQYKDFLVGKHEWKKEYPRLLDELEDNLGRYDYCEILLQEKEYTKLIDQLKKYNSMAMIRRYAPDIYKFAKQPVTELYLNSVVIPQSNKKTASGPAQLASDITKFLNFSKDLDTTKKWVKQLKGRLGKTGKFRDAFGKVDDSIDRFELMKKNKLF